MSRDLDVLCFGEALVDLLPDRRGRLRSCERFDVHSGGAPSNVAVGLARLGLKVAFRGVVGDDELGHLLDRKLAAEGIDRRFRFTAEARTGIWFIALDEKGERTFFSPTGTESADKLLAPADADPALIAEARWLHCGSSSHVRRAGQEALRTAVAAAAQVGTWVSFDPNVRLHLWRDLGELRALCADVLPRVHLAKLSEDETEVCIGERDPARAAAKLCDLGVTIACVTLGARGALVRRGREVLQIAAPAVDVVDTTGAGDGFVAGTLSRLAVAGAPGEIPLEALEQAAIFGCRVGSRVCTALGAVAGLPRRGEL